MILSIGAISAETIDDDSMQLNDDSISIDSVDDSISDISPEDNIISENEINPYDLILRFKSIESIKQGWYILLSETGLKYLILLLIVQK